MIGKLAKVGKKEFTIVGCMGWGFPTTPHMPYIRYVWITSGKINKEGKRIDVLEKISDVKILK